MKSCCLLLSRFCLAAWVGAALFFVLILFDFRRSPLFDESTKTDHAKVLFPAYYQFEMGTVGIALVTTLASRGHPAVRRTRHRVQLGFMFVATAVALVDYIWVYLPLSVMISSGSFPAEFRAYHRASMWFNAADLVLWMAAALVALWPGPRQDAAPLPRMDRSDSRG